MARILLATVILSISFQVFGSPPNFNPESLMSASDSEIEAWVADYRKFLNSNEFKNLSAEKKYFHQAQLDKVVNFKLVKNHLEDCLVDVPDDRNLHVQILSGAATLDPCHVSPNKGNFQGSQNLTDVSSVLKHSSLDDFKSSVKLHSLNQAGQALLRYQAKFPSEWKGPGTVPEVISQICGGNCNDQEINFLENEFLKTKDAQADAILNNFLRPFDLKQTEAELQERVSDLNKQIKTIARLKKEKGEDSKEVIDQYNLYTQKYISYVSDEVGGLLIGTSMGKRVGRMRDLSEISVRQVGRAKSTVYRGNHGSLRPHCSGHNKAFCEGKDGLKYLRASLQTSQNKILEFIKNTRNESNLNELLKSSPVASGQALVTHPAMIGQVCDAIIEISETDQRNQLLLNGAEKAMAALDVASIGLLAVGGIGLLTKGVSIVGRAAMSVASRATIAGTAASVTRGVAGTIGNDYYTSEKESLQRARLAKAQTPDQYNRIAELEKEIDEAHQQLLDAGIDAASFGIIGTATRLRSSGQMAKMAGFNDDMKGILKADAAYASAVKRLGNSRHLAAQNSLKRALDQNQIDPQDVEALLVAMTGRTQKEVDEMLDMIGKADPEDIKLALAGAKEKVAACSI